ncbi:oligosaccharide flippase family protein [Vibrio sp. SBT000027]|uniref:oligosaccharide flippase family protein n=1 Tax=Vibrio sp. SBT000027 TaxID=1803384 RepID=UPI000EF485F5|nr:oligosaccharide flippase family protein [Vibrio sp. SBT000027]RLQ15597.1 polysaccharide biosynthesis protein [Vibrio sp. SBT000027]
MLKRLWRFSASYAMVEGVQKGILFLLLPVFTRYMTPDEYGVVASVLMLVPFFIIAFSLSIQASITRYYFKYKHDKELLREFLGTNFTLLALVSLFMMSIVLIFGKDFFELFFSEIDFNPYIIYALIIGSLQPIIIAYFALLKAMQNIFRYMVLFNCYFSIQISLMLFTIINLDLKHDGYILSLLFSNLIFAIIFLILLSKKVRFGLNKKYIKESLTYCLPIVPVDGIGLVSSIVDRYFIIKFISLTAVGVYFVGYQIAMLVSLISLAINSAYTPIFFGKYESGDKCFSDIYRMSDYIVYFTSFIALIISVLSPFFVTLLFDKDYYESSDVIIYLSFLGAIKSIYFLNTNVLSLEPKLVKLKTIGIVIGAIVTSILGFFMTKYFGLVGAAISTLLGFFVTTVILIIIVRNKTQFTFNNFKSMSFIISLFILSLICQMIDHMLYKAMVMIFVLTFTLVLFEIEFFKRVVNEYFDIKK